MTLRHVLADVRIFIAFFLALLGIGVVIHSDANTTNYAGLVIGSVIGSAGLTAVFLVWLSALAGEKEG